MNSKVYKHRHFGYFALCYSPLIFWKIDSIIFT